MHEIRALAEAGLGVLFTTHDPNHAMRAATRAYLLRDGTCLADGEVSEVLTQGTLEQLYRAKVQIMREGERVAFLPG
jgi:iron complex transport system ATP-binding protein